MVLPAIPVALGVATLAGIGGIGYFTKKWWSSKRIAVLGGRGVGKTTFINYLETKKVKSGFEQTDLELYPALTVKIEGVTLRISSGYDVGGSSMQHGEWRKQVLEADIIFYILDISRILKRDSDYIESTKSDIDAIKNEIRQRKNIQVFLIASHIDKLKDDGYTAKKLEDKINKNQVIQIAMISFGGSDYCKVVTGSLKDTQSAETLMKKILISYDKK